MYLVIQCGSCFEFWKVAHWRLSSLLHYWTFTLLSEASGADFTQIIKCFDSSVNYRHNKNYQFEGKAIQDQ